MSREPCPMLDEEVPCPCSPGYRCPGPEVDDWDEQSDAASTEFHANVDVPELVGAVRDLVHHVARMAEDWAEMGPGEQRNRDLWAPLHRKAEAVRDLIGEVPR